MKSDARIKTLVVARLRGVVVIEQRASDPLDHDRAVRDLGSLALLEGGWQTRRKRGIRVFG